jgi:nicotinate-nucleotide pyrophosphorylase (carboxylating)
VAPGDAVVTISGNARALLTAERVALNYLGRLSGIASLTARYVDAVGGTGAAIVDTRKTTPGLRAFEKYAVRCGGGRNHRTGLFDAILIKDNHIIAAGGIAEALSRARALAGHMVKIEIEVDTLDQLDEVLRHKVDAILLDNMTPSQLRKAVKMVGRRAATEASGGVSLDTVRAIAETGVDMISVGALTHSAPVLDLGLDFKLPAA